MNRVLKNIFSAKGKFFPVQDVYTAFNLLRELPDINLIVVDIDENCIDCLDFISFITTSKVYNRDLVILVSSNQIDKVNAFRNIDSVKIYAKPFDPIRLTLDSLELINTVP